MLAGAARVVSLRGDYDVFRTPELDMELRGIDGVRFVVVDFSSVKYISSSAIGALIRMRTRRTDADLPAAKFAGLSPTLQRIFALLGLDQAWQRYADAASAMRSFEAEEVG